MPINQNDGSVVMAAIGAALVTCRVAQMPARRAICNQIVPEWLILVIKMAANITFRRNPCPLYEKKCNFAGYLKNYG